MSDRQGGQGGLWGPLLGAAAGAYVMHARHAARRESRAYKDDPEFVDEVCEEVEEFLGRWTPRQAHRKERGYTLDLAAFLRRHTDFDVEVEPATEEGFPDIIVGGVLVIELKLRASKAELDRLVGQAARYSRKFETWVLLLGSTESQVRQFEWLLEDRDLEMIEVWTTDT